MEGSIAFLYAALGVTLAAIVGYLLLLNGRLTALRRERAALEHDNEWPDSGASHSWQDEGARDAEAGRPA